MKLRDKVVIGLTDWLFKHVLTEPFRTDFDRTLDLGVKLRRKADEKIYFRDHSWRPAGDVVQEILCEPNLVRMKVDSLWVEMYPEEVDNIIECLYAAARQAEKAEQDWMKP